MSAIPTSKLCFSHALRERAAHGFTLPEMTLAVVLLAGLLALVAAAYNHVLTRARVDDTRVLLARLRGAAIRLEGVSAENGENPVPGVSLLEALCREPTAAVMLRDISPNLWRCIDEKAAGARLAYCVDAWGTPIRVITAAGLDATTDRRLQLAGGDAIFESAGPDREFGDENSIHAMDNIGSDDPSAAVESPQ